MIVLFYVFSFLNSNINAYDFQALLNLEGDNIFTRNYEFDILPDNEKILSEKLWLVKEIKRKGDNYLFYKINPTFYSNNHMPQVFSLSNNYDSLFVRNQVMESILDGGVFEIQRSPRSIKFGIYYRNSNLISILQQKGILHYNYYTKTNGKNRSAFIEIVSDITENNFLIELIEYDE